MQASVERTQMRSHCTARRGDELRRQAEICRQLAAPFLAACREPPQRS
jgi:hypothetical protein